MVYYIYLIMGIALIINILVIVPVNLIYRIKRKGRTFIFVLLYVVDSAIIIFVSFLGDIDCDVLKNVSAEFGGSKSEMSAIFVVLWGISITLITYWMEHRKDQVIGVSISSIVLKSIGRVLTLVSFGLIYIEVLLFAWSILSDNALSGLALIVLQVLNNIVLLLIKWIKQEPDSVFVTCRDEIKRTRKKIKNDLLRHRKNKEDIDFSDMLFFEMVENRRAIYSSKLERVYNELLCDLLSEYNGENENTDYEKYAFRYALDLVENLFRGEESASWDVSYIFGQQECNISNADKKAILFYMIESDSYFDFSEVLILLKRTDTPDYELYSWCGVWCCYWWIVSNNTERLKNAYIMADVLIAGGRAEFDAIKYLDYMADLDVNGWMVAATKWNGMIRDDEKD